MSKVQIPSGKPAGRIICPRCGNAKDFVELASNVLVTNHYIQNSDGSFTPMHNATEVAGEIKLFCGKCSADLSEFQAHFQEMIF